ncbi:branched chain amino acid ABC transporter substrate-binding protein [Salinisphaera dokdonensis CL-ES53]|uniref:Branched chain amino acid ABC transporter substrate-binding protein n=1 Tax=Salinisphaera dokdonensis CL-ES53 TaxID=1304272 RepID=A0ABV2B247_9GAMM
MSELKLALKRAAVGAILTSATALAFVAPSVSMAAEEPIRIGYIDPLSGPFANVGDAGLKQFRYLAEKMNAEGGILGRDIEIVGFDNKSSAQESLQMLREAADEGIHYVTQGNGSHVAGALVDGVEKHNRRNPDNRIVFLNYAAVDPTLTNEKCSFWHFRFDANSAMKMKAITDYMADQPKIKKVFLINQDYSHGQFISQAGKELLAEKRSDIEVVGDVLHPVGKVKDFSPYISRIKASGADTVITGNWGNDLSLLVKAGDQAGLDVDWYTYYAGGLGTPTSLGKAADGKVKMITEWQENLAVRFEADELRSMLEEFETRYDGIEFYYLRVKTEMDMLKKAMEKAGSADPKAVAFALEGLSIDTPFGTASMRADDHQLMQPLFMSTFGSDFLEYDSEGTGLGWKMDAEIPADQTAVETSCEMKRPERTS